MSQALVKSLPKLSQLQAPTLSDFEKKILLLQTIRSTFIDPIVTPITEIVKSLASNPVTGLPLLATSSEYLYKYSPSFLRLRRELATLLLSPSAIGDTANIAISGFAKDLGQLFNFKRDPINDNDEQFELWLDANKENIKELEKAQQTLADWIKLTKQRLVNTKASIGGQLGINQVGIDDLERQLSQHTIRFTKITNVLSNGYLNNGRTIIESVKGE